MSRLKILGAELNLPIKRAVLPIFFNLTFYNHVLLILGAIQLLIKQES